MWVTKISGGGGSEKVGDATIQSSYQASAGDLVLFLVGFDNTTTTTPTITSLTKQAGETNNWYLVAKVDSNQASSGAGVRGEIWALNVTVGTGGGYAVIDATLSGNATAKAWGAYTFAGGPNPITLRHATPANGVTSATAISTTVNTITGAAPQAGDLVVLLTSEEGGSGQTATAAMAGVNGWTTLAGNGTSGSGGASNMAYAALYQIASASGDITIPTWSTAADKGVTAAVFTAGPAPLNVGFSGSGSLSGRRTTYEDVMITSGANLFAKLETLPDLTKRIGYNDSQSFPVNLVGDEFGTLNRGTKTFWNQSYNLPEAVARTNVSKGIVGGLVYPSTKALDPDLAQMTVTYTDPDNVLTGGDNTPPPWGFQTLTASAIINLRAYPSAGQYGGIWINSRNRWVFQIDSAGKLYFYAYCRSGDPLSGPNASYEAFGSTVLQLGRTYHVAVSFNGNQIVLYVDGVADATVTTTAGSYFMWASSGTGQIWMGQGLMGGSSSERLKGTIDMPAIWGSGLTATQINEQVTAMRNGPVNPQVGLSGSGSLGAFVNSYPTAVMGSGPDAYLRLGEASGTVAEDYTSNNRDGTYVGSPLLGQPSLLADPSSTSMRPTTANGAPAKGVTLPYWSGAFTGDFSWEVVYKPTQIGLMDYILAGGGPAANLGMSSDGNLQWQMDLAASSTWVGGPNLAAGETYHIVCLVDASDVARLYVNGIEYSGGMQMSSRYAGAGSTFTIGHSVTGGWNCSGYIDEVAYYSRALTQNEIIEHYRAVSATAGIPTGSGSLAGAGTLTTSGIPALLAGSGLGGAGTLSIGTRVPGTVGSTALAGSGSLALSAAKPGPVASLGTSGAGTFSIAAPTPALVNTLGLSGVGALTPSAVTPTAIQSLPLAGAGTFATSAPTPGVVQSANLSGDGTLALSGVASSDGAGSANLTSSGSLGLAGTPTTTASVSLAGAGTLGLVGSPTPVATVGLASSGALGAATVGLSTAGTSATSGAGSLTTAGSAATQGSITPSGSGSLNAGGVPTTTYAATLAGDGGLVITSPKAALVGQAYLTSDGTLATVSVGDLQLNGAGALSLDAQPTVMAQISLSGSGLLREVGTARDITVLVGITRVGTVHVKSGRVGTAEVAASRTGTAAAGPTRQGVEAGSTRHDRGA